MFNLVEVRFVRDKVWATSINCLTTRRFTDDMHIWCPQINTARRTTYIALLFITNQGVMHEKSI